MHDFAVLISWVIRSSLYKARKCAQKNDSEIHNSHRYIKCTNPIALNKYGLLKLPLKLQKVKSFIPVINIGCELSLQKN